MTDPENRDLSERIARAKEAQDKTEKKNRQVETACAVSAGAMALRYGAEFGAAVFVGIMIGYGIDEYFGTRPWGLLIMLGFGLAAGVLGVIRAYRELTASANAAMSSPETDDETEELKS
ncbi:MAG: AtpZ/AtpI family protein [Henriciella sp.]|nr:AtpZ/AtpI family protein [Henriciella sp.]